MSSEMKIGIVCYPTYGGSGVVATELGLGLAKKGYEIHFITYKRPPRLSSFHENVFYHEVSPTEYPLFDYPPYDSALTSKLVDVVMHENLDLLHVHYAIPHAAVAFLAKQILLASGKYIPVITTLHGTDITLVGIDPCFAPVVEFSINNSDGVTAVSDSLRKDTYANFDIRKEIAVIPNFIDLKRFQKMEKSHFKKAIAQNGEKIITHTSNFRKVKRVEDVVKSFHLISTQIQAKLLLIGDGPERPKLEELSRNLGLEDSILFLGKQDAIEELLAVSDLFFLPSEKESFGLSALEAMACEVPVISTNAGGIPEVNVHGLTGFVSEIGDVEDMSRNAVKILENEKVHLEFKKRAYEQAIQFDIEKILPEYEKLYCNIAEKAMSS